MPDSEGPPISAHVRGHLDEAERQLEAAESEQPDGALAPAKAVLVQLVRRATWHQRAFDRAILRALEVLGADLEAVSGDRARRFAGIEEGLARCDERLTQLEKRAARTEALLATLATDLHDLRDSLSATATRRSVDTREDNGTGRDG